MGDNASFSGGVFSPAFVEDGEALKQFVAAMPSLVVMLAPDGTVLAHSDRWADLFGADAGLDGGPGTHSFFDLFADPDDTWTDTFRDSLAAAETRRGYVRPLTRTTGTTYWVDWEVRPWRTAPDGDPEGLLLYLTDRTGQHRAQVTRRRVEQRFDALVDTISEGVLLMDNRGVFRDCNEAAQDILGRPTEDIVGSRFDDDTWNGLREDGTPLPNEAFPFWRAYTERETVPDEVMGIYPPDAPPRWIQVNAQPLFHEGEEDPYAVLVCFDDVTDAKLKEEALQTSRDLLSSVLSSSLDGITVLSAVRDADGRVVDFECELVNPQAEKLLGTTAEDLVGQRVGRLMPEQEEKGLVDGYRRVVETGEPFETEVRYDVNGEEVWFQVMAVSVDDGVAVTFRDISERKEAAQAMAAANAKLERRNRALRDFAYIASHDLQEPLRKIRAFSNLVLEDYADAIDDTGGHYLERMQDAAERMSQLINDLLVYSRITTQAQPFEAVDLKEIAENVRHDLDLQIADVDGTVDIGPLPTIEADPTQVRQLLQNLIGNGLKFHKPDEPPRVEVTARVEPAAAELKQSGRLAADCADMCRLTIADNGIGFEESHTDRIFSPFKRLHGREEYEGTGMGLAICRRIVERHGGDITADSAPGEGTTFTILLPVARTDEASSPTTASSDLVTKEPT
jgi:PAS domain S-box-containing protein